MLRQTGADSHSFESPGAAFHKLWHIQDCGRAIFDQFGSAGCFPALGKRNRSAFGDWTHPDFLSETEGREILFLQ